MTPILLTAILLAVIAPRLLIALVAIAVVISALGLSGAVLAVLLTVEGFVYALAGIGMCMVAYLTIDYIFNHRG